MARGCCGKPTALAAIALASLGEDTAGLVLAFALALASAFAFALPVPAPLRACASVVAGRVRGTRDIGSSCVGLLRGTIVPELLASLQLFLFPFVAVKLFGRVEASVLLVASIFGAAAEVRSSGIFVAHHVFLPLSGSLGLAAGSLRLGRAAPIWGLGSGTRVTTVFTSPFGLAVAASLCWGSLLCRCSRGLRLLVAKRTPLACIGALLTLLDKLACGVTLALAICHDVIRLAKSCCNFGWCSWAACTSAIGIVATAISTPEAELTSTLIQRRFMPFNVELFFFPQHDQLDLLN